MYLYSPITSISGVGESTSKKLAHLGISTVFDLLYHLPFRYEDRTKIFPLSSVQPGETITAEGQIVTLQNDYTRNGKIIQKGILENSSGKISILWFNQPFLVKSLAKKSAFLFGKVDFFGAQKALISPDYELPSPNHPPLHLARIVPIYPETQGVTSKWIRTKIYQILTSLKEDEILPESFGLMNWKQALWQVHFPDTLDLAQEARNRLAFDELFLLQLISLRHRQLWQHTKLAHSFSINQSQISNFISQLPFSLTSTQNQAVNEILSDLTQTHPMNRLLEGDVGSGKTVVAATAAYAAYLNGLQTIIMAPTQILASQHYQTLSTLFYPLKIDVSLVTSNHIPKNNTSHILVGTHALLSEKNQSLISQVGLVVIDEQHRFGVTQRSLASQLGQSPHILTMTATPIPRTIALTMFGDLDLSTLTDKPTGRLPIKTWVIPDTKRQSSYDWITEQIDQTKHQVFWVCPFIDESDNQSSVKAATTEYENLVKIFPHHTVGLLHGRLKSAQKDEVINRFRSGEIQILVATPVVEVGIDIPNANIMVIEGAERFGLAQLHQLRGRVGRSSQQSFCLLFTSDGQISPRLKAMETNSNGLSLAEIDLKLRGPGDIYGTAQHGLPQFKVATFSNLQLIQSAKSAAEKTLSQLSSFPLLQKAIEEDKIALIQPN